MKLSILIFCILILVSCDLKQNQQDEQLARELRYEIEQELRAERIAQNQLPQSQHPFWKLMAQSKVSFNEGAGFYSIESKNEIDRFIGKQIEISGFIIPLDGNDLTRHFLIGVNTPVCFYHPPGEPNQLMEVYSKKPVKWTTEKEIFMRGTLAKISNSDAGIFYSLKNAEEIKRRPQ